MIKILYLSGVFSLSFTATKGSILNMFQHDTVRVQKARSVKTRFFHDRLEELLCPAQSPDHNPPESLPAELELASLMPDLTNGKLSITMI